MQEPETTTSNLNITHKAFDCIRHTLDSHKDFISKMKLNPLVKDSLIGDVTKIDDIMNQFKKRK